MGIRLAQRLSYTKIDTAASGASDLVVVPATHILFVVSYALVAAGAVSVKFLSQAADLTGAIPLTANGGVSFPGTVEGPALRTLVRGDDLRINLSGAVQVSGHLAYFTVHGDEAHVA